MLISWHQADEGEYIEGKYRARSGASYPKFCRLTEDDSCRVERRIRTPIHSKLTPSARFILRLHRHSSHSLVESCYRVRFAPWTVALSVYSTSKRGASYALGSPSSTNVQLVGLSSSLHPKSP